MTTGLGLGFATLGAAGAASVCVAFRVETSRTGRRCIQGHCSSAAAISVGGGAISVGDGATVAGAGATPVIATMLTTSSPESGF